MDSQSLKSKGMELINIEKRGKILIVTLNVKKINALNADELKEHISQLFSDHNARVILDLKGVENIDSSGFGCLLSSSKAAKNNYGIIKLANAEPVVMKLFETLHLNKIFDIYPDTESCLSHF
jgi:anti-sigma B factor antagonist